jgi:ABC-2 type transport system permease protein
MLWYKSWLETRWRFLIGLAVLICSAGGVVLTWPKVVELMPLAANIDVSGEIGRRIKEATELSREYRGYVWMQWFRQNLTQMGTLFAVLLGAGGLLSSGGAALFTLSLPVSRRRLLGVRAAAGLAELFVLAMVPSLLIPLLSPAVGKTYPIRDALIHGVCLFIAATAFFSLAILLSTVFSDLWRPLLIALSVAVALAVCEQIFSGLSTYSIFRVMSAEAYFRSGQLPWLGLLASAAAAAAMLYGAADNLERHDF